MDNEIEAQFLDIDKDIIRTKLKKLGAELVKPEVLMKRVVFSLDDHSYARVRDEGDKIVMTYKNVLDENSILGTKEVNVVVDNYDNAILLLKSCGLKPKSREESYREKWVLNNVELCIDTWPWIPTFLEIEGPSEEEVWKVAEKLGLDKSKAKFGSVDSTYRHYCGIDESVFNNETPEVDFEMEPPEWAKKEVKNGRRQA